MSHASLPSLLVGFGGLRLSLGGPVLDCCGMTLCPFPSSVKNVPASRSLAASVTPTISLLAGLSSLATPLLVGQKTLETAFIADSGNAQPVTG